MKLVKVCLLTVLLAVGLVTPVWAQQQDHQAATPPLVQLLQSKGILSPDEAAQLSQASSADEANARLAQLLVAKGLISQEDYSRTVATTELASDAGSGGHYLNAVVHATSRSASQPRPPTSDPFTFGAPAEGGVIPAIAPVRVLPIDTPKDPGGLIPDIKLGSGAMLSPYGFIKATAIYDSTNSGGSTFGNNDFPLPLLLGDTGPDRGSQFHVKARSTRLGTNFYWPKAHSDLIVTGKVEFDFEGDFTTVNNRNVSSIRSSQASIRLAWVRMDGKLADLPVFAEFGQDWTLLASSTLPDIVETTQLMAFFGNMYERLPQIKGGVQFHIGDLKIQPEAAVLLAAFGDANLANTPPGIPVPTNSVAEQLNPRFGARIGSDSGQPAVEGRIVLQYPLFRRPGVAPAQVIFSAHHATGSEIVLHGTLNTALSQTAVEIPGLTGCATPDPLTGLCTVAQFFPQGFRFDIPQNIWTAEFQLPTPWVTVVGKYFNGGDTRFFFGTTNSTFADTMGQKVIANGIADSGDNIPFVNIGGSAVFAQLRPVRDQGGFLQVSFPLSRILGADPEGHNAGWTYSVTGGVDNTKARDVNRTGANGLTRSDYVASTLRYKINRWASIVNETTWYDTRTADAQLKLYRGVDAHTAHDWRNEFGTIITF
jgi:hypothetical protein